MTESKDKRLATALDVTLPIALALALGVVIAVDEGETTSMDVVFLLDENAGLGESAEPIKANWLRTAASLREQGFDCRFAVAPCSAGLSLVPRIAWTADSEKLQSDLREAGDGAETDLLTALEGTLSLEFRDDALRVVMLTTNAFVDAERLGTLAERFREHGITAIVQAPASEQASFRPLYKYGGQFYTLTGENKTEPSEEGTDEKSVDFSLVSNIAAGNPAEFQTAVIAGVKVKGKIALVCDISGSMSSDFPPLVRELRQKFPADTPLILIRGCHFGPSSGWNQQPTPLSRGSMFQRVHGVDFSEDQHVYYSNNTTDAVILAINHFKRNTVMFNNDLQDGGSRQAIEAFEELLRKRRFTLSGRSLNCDAPGILKNFIKKTGGDFKVDPIHRRVSPAVSWGG